MPWNWLRTIYEVSDKPPEEERISITHGNAMDLSAFPNDTYDITLLLGPLYHLYSREDKLQALREAIRVTKKGGVIFAAYVISDGCLLDEGFHRGNINVAEYIEGGQLDPHTFAVISKPKDLFELVRKENIDDLMCELPVTRLHYVAADGFALYMREAVDAMDDRAFALYLKYHFATCERRIWQVSQVMRLIYSKNRHLFCQIRSFFSAPHTERNANSREISVRITGNTALSASVKSPTFACVRKISRNEVTITALEDFIARPVNRAIKLMLTITADFRSSWI